MVVLNSWKMKKNDSMYKMNERILFSNGSKMRFILVEDIRIIEAEGDFSILDVSDGNNYRMLRSLKDWELKLPEQSFIRINKSNIVNIDFIDRIRIDQNRTARVYIKDKTEPLRLSRFYLKKVRHQYN
jgi:DNA-binding LytR/AlgR family response regulator